MSKADRVELDIKRLSHELLLSDEQAEKFAVTYRDYANELDAVFQKGREKGFVPGKDLTDKEIDKLVKQRIENFKAISEIQLKYYDKFRKDLSARQAEKVIQFNECGPKPCCDKHHGKKDARKGDKKLKAHRHDGPRPEGRPEGPRPEFPQPAE